MAKPLGNSVVVKHPWIEVRESIETVGIRKVIPTKAVAGEITRTLTLVKRKKYNHAKNYCTRTSLPGWCDPRAGWAGRRYQWRLYTWWLGRSRAALRKQLDMPFDLLLGRKTFDIWEPYWPQRGDIWPNVNKATKYVASNTRTSSEWQPSVFLGGDVAEKVAKIKQEDGPDLHVWGSSDFLQTLIQQDLVDIFWLMIYPVTLGSGKRLFAHGTIPAAFKVTESVVAPTGVIVVAYERDGELKTQAIDD